MLLMDCPYTRGGELPDYAKNATWKILHVYIYIYIYMHIVKDKLMNLQHMDYKLSQY